MPDAFPGARARVEQLVRTEVALRLARLSGGGRALSDPLDFSISLLDRSDRLRRRSGEGGDCDR